MPPDGSTGHRLIAATTAAHVPPGRRAHDRASQGTSRGPLSAYDFVPLGPEERHHCTAAGAIVPPISNPSLSSKPPLLGDLKFESYLSCQEP
jgi:hypothetical protein